MKNKKALIVVISILVPAIVALLFVFTTQEANLGSWVHSLPAFNASINGIAAVVLILALIMIKKGNEKLHKKLMLFAFALGALFLVSYVTYHASVPSTIYGDLNHDGVLSESESIDIGGWRTFYIVFLLTHILVAIIGLPLVLTALYHAISGNKQTHKKIVRFAYPVWMFIAISGVLVYFLISPYY
jgi:putative membrane protein